MTKARVSVITPTLNQGIFIRAALRSVRRQVYPDIEHIICDGGSTDGTLSILKEEPGNFQWTSENDSGQADAMNKGFRRASGEILTWLNSDDVLATPTAVAQVADTFERHPSVGIVYGDYIVIDERGGQLYARREIKFNQRILKYGNVFIRPAAFIRRSVVEQIGEFDPSLRYSMDYDYWLRAIAAGIEFKHCPHPLFGHRAQPDAKTVSQHKRMMQETYSLRRIHGPVRSGAALRALRVLGLMEWQARKLAQRGSLDNFVASFLSHRYPTLWSRLSPPEKRQKVVEGE